MIPRRRKPRRGTLTREDGPTVKTFPDGREVCSSSASGRREYQRRLRIMYDRQSERCRICGKFMPFFDFTFDHEDGRGMNGSHRDDRIFRNGKPYNGAVHLKCNGEKGSKRGYAV